MAKSKGALVVNLEVDRANVSSRRIHEILGARFVRDYVTADGRVRSVMEYRLTDERSRFSIKTTEAEMSEE